MTPATFWADHALTPRDHGIGAFVAEHPHGVPLGRILGFFRDPDIEIARALDRLETHGYVTHTTPDGGTLDLWAVTYTATDKLTGGAA